MATAPTEIPNMRVGQFESLRLELLRSGVSPLYAERTVLELEEHYADLESAALASGLEADEAARVARATLGNEGAIVAAILAHPELLTFSTRYPRFAQCLQSAATIGALPGLPLMFCIEHRPELTRWVAAVGLAATLMGSVLATLDWLIVLPPH
jgi:hypothetical protein